MIHRTIFIPLIVFCAFLLSAPIGAETVDRIVAKVGTDVITLSDVTRAIAEQRQYLRDTGAEAKRIEAEMVRFKTNVVEEMILQKILESEIKREKISALPSEVDQEYKGRLRQFGVTDVQMANKLAQDGLSVSEYKESLRRQIEKRSFIQKKISPNLNISDFDVQKEYQAQIAKFQTFQKVRFIEVVLLKDKFPNPDELKKMAGEILNRFKKGQSASDLIKANSSGAFATSGGDSGVVDATTLREEIQDVLNSLKPGEVSPVLTTGSGIFIFKLVSHSDPKPIPYNKVSTLIRNQVGDKMVQKELRKYLLGVRERTYVEIIK